jgi:integrase
MTRSNIGRVYQRKNRGGQWYVRLRKDGHEVVRAGGQTKAEALRELDRLRAEFKAGGPPRGDASFEDYAESHAEFLESRVSPTTIGPYMCSLAVWVEAFKGKRLRSIRSADIRRVLKYGRADVKPGTRNRDLSVLSGLFREALDERLVSLNPCLSIKREREEERPVPAMTPAEQDAVLAACPERLREAATVALGTGLRRGELARLAWGDVNLDRGILTVRRSKAGRPRMVHMMGRTVKVLSRLRTGRVVPLGKPDLVFPWLKWGVTSRIYLAWKQAVREAGFPDLRWHDLRHLYGVNGARAGVPMPTLMKLMGHSSLKMTMRYAGHVAVSDLSFAAELMESSLGGPGGSGGTVGGTISESGTLDSGASQAERAG